MHRAACRLRTLYHAWLPSALPAKSLSSAAMALSSSNAGNPISLAPLTPQQCVQAAPMEHRCRSGTASRAGRSGARRPGRGAGGGAADATGRPTRTVPGGTAGRRRRQRHATAGLRPGPRSPPGSRRRGSRAEWAPRRSDQRDRTLSPRSVPSIKGAQPRDLPVPMPNSRWTRSQNASRSHSRASW